MIEEKLHQYKICLVNGKKQIKSENMMLVSIFISFDSFNDGSGIDGVPAVVKAETASLPRYQRRPAVVKAETASLPRILANTVPSRRRGEKTLN